MGMFLGPSVRQLRDVPIVVSMTAPNLDQSLPELSFPWSVDVQNVKVSEPPLISVVDDDESVREAIESLLKSVGLRVAVLASAEEFLSSPHLEVTDCLILDVRMPGMNGLEMQRQLRAANSRIPVIFITAHGDEEARAQALAAGAVAFLHKPFSEDALLSAIEMAL
jgi:FixJ family two-component response regulator